MCLCCQQPSNRQTPPLCVLQRFEDCAVPSCGRSRAHRRLVQVQGGRCGAQVGVRKAMRVAAEAEVAVVGVHHMEAHALVARSSAASAALPGGPPQVSCLPSSPVPNAPDPVLRMSAHLYSYACSYARTHTSIHAGLCQWGFRIGTPASCTDSSLIHRRFYLHIARMLAIHCWPFLHSHWGCHLSVPGVTGLQC